MASKLERAQCEAAMRDGEFPPDVTASGPRVAVVLTQGWCPQWTMMSSWLEAAEAEAGARVWFLEYDREPFFEEFMAFKEDVFGNRSVPYVRYYRDGKLAAQGNYLSRDGFVRNLTR